MAAKARILKCPCGYCKQWELRRPSGTLFSRYRSQQAAVRGMGKMFTAMKEQHMTKVHRDRQGKQ